MKPDRASRLALTIVDTLMAALAAVSVHLGHAPDWAVLMTFVIVLFCRDSRGGRA